MKGIYFIIVLVIIAIVLNQIVSINLKNIQQWESVNLRDKSKNILETLTGNKNCLAYEEVANIEGTDVNLTSHRIIDVNKLRYFVDNFAELEPDCVRDFEYGYRVKVETFLINMKTGFFTHEGSVFDQILSRIRGKKIVFIVDVSSSMDRFGGKCDVDPDRLNTKICCLKLFMSGFIEEMEDESMITILRYGHDPDACEPDMLFPFTELEGNRDWMNDTVMELEAIDMTPMCKALEKGFEIAINDRADAIVLLTDGCENRCCETEETHQVAERFKDRNIPVYTIAYGHQACPSTLIKTAEYTGGKYFGLWVISHLGITPILVIMVQEVYGFH